MQLLYAGMAAAGVALSGWGLWGAHRLRRPLDIAAALAAVVGCILFVLGILLAVIPDFFSR